MFFDEKDAKNTTVLLNFLKILVSRNALRSLPCHAKNGNGGSCSVLIIKHFCSNFTEAIDRPKTQSHVTINASMWLLCQCWCCDLPASELPDGLSFRSQNQEPASSASRGSRKWRNSSSTCCNCADPFALESCRKHGHGRVAKGESKPKIDHDTITPDLRWTGDFNVMPICKCSENYLKCMKTC